MHVSQHQPSVSGGNEPAGGRNRSLYVPIRQGPAGNVVRLWRTPYGSRTAVAFTTDRLLRSVLGPTQPWIRLSAAALRRLTEPLGTTHLTIDPILTSRPPRTVGEGHLPIDGEPLPTAAPVIVPGTVPAPVPAPGPGSAVDGD